MAQSELEKYLQHLHDNTVTFHSNEEGQLVNTIMADLHNVEYELNQQNKPTGNMWEKVSKMQEVYRKYKYIRNELSIAFVEATVEAANCAGLSLHKK